MLRPLGGYAFREKFCGGPIGPSPRRRFAMRAQRPARRWPASQPRRSFGATPACSLRTSTMNSALLLRALLPAALTRAGWEHRHGERKPGRSASALAAWSSQRSIGCAGVSDRHRAVPQAHVLLLHRRGRRSLFVGMTMPLGHSDLQMRLPHDHPPSRAEMPENAARHAAPP